MCHLPFWSQFSKNIFIWSHWITNSVSNFWPWNKKLRVYKIKTFALHLHFEFARPVRIYMRWFSNSCGVTKEFWWWMASWQHGPSEGLGFSSCSLLFIPRCQSLYGNQLLNPSGPFLPLFLQPFLLGPDHCLSQTQWENQAESGQEPSEDRNQLLAWKGLLVGATKEEGLRRGLWFRPLLLLLADSSSAVLAGKGFSKPVK